MKKLSVVLAVFNEENNLRQCLESVKSMAGEIVVVDGGSQDKTVEIAREFGARVIQTTNPPVFHINKNKAIKAAKEDWVLQLDADEVVTKELAQEIKREISKKSDINGYWIPRRNFFLGRFLTKGGQYPDYTLRLYKNGKGILPAKDVHEQAKVEGETAYLKADLLHLRDKSFSEYMLRFNRYTDLISLQMKKSGVRIDAYNFTSYTLLQPLMWFLKTYFRHRGYKDSFPGFVFSLFSSLRFPVSFIKYWSSYASCH